LINQLDNLLRDLFLENVDKLTDEAQIRFQPPDEDWRGQVANLNQMALNVYLVDLRENRKLRSNERIRNVENGIVNEEPAPARLDCHYLITAWSPAQPGAVVEPTLDEHLLLYEVTGVLINNYPLNPSRIYPPGSAALAAVPELIREADLITDIVPVEGFTKLAEFWGTMGVNHRWKPAVYLIVTVPVALETEIAGPMVTTRITDYRMTGRPETAEVFFQIGGQVLDTINPQLDGSPSLVGGAWVRLETTGGEGLQTTETNELGRFTFGNLQRDSYRLRTRATGLGELIRDIEVPSPTGEYDLKFE
jgi:hypothetical protein